MAVEISANNAKFNQALMQSQSRLNKFEGVVKSTAASLIGGFSAYTVYRGLERGITIIAEFEKKMSQVRAITGATGSEFEALRKNALELGRATEYTARQVGDLQIEYGRLGFTTKEILDATGATLNLATATGEDLARSAEIAGATLRAFQLDASEMGRVTDVITGSLNKSALALDSFADGMKYVAPVAEATNVSLEETSAALSVLANAGIKGSQAGTSLRRIFTLLDRSGKPFSERLTELARKGITLADANDEVGLYAQTALLVLAKQDEQVKALTETYRQMNGEAQRTADIMRDNLIGDFDKLRSAMEGLVLEGSNLTPLFRALTQNATSLLNTISGTIDPLKEYENVLHAIRTGGSFRDYGVRGQDFEADIALLQRLAREAKLDFSAVGPTQSTGVLPGSEFFDKEAVEKTKQAAEEAGRRAEANKKAREEAEKELKALIELRRETFEASQEKELDFSDISDPFGGRRFLSSSSVPEFSGSDFLGFKDVLSSDSSFASIVDEAASQAVTDFADTYNEAMQQMHDADNRNLESQEQLRASFIQTNETIAAFASSIGDAAAMAIASEQSFEQAFSRIALQIISHYEKVALGAIIANAAKDPTKPGVFSKIAAATIGFAAIKALFAKIGASSSGGSAGGFSPRAVDSANFNQRPLEINLTGNWRLEGSTLVAAIDKAEYQRGRLG